MVDKIWWNAEQAEQIINYSSKYYMMPSNVARVSLNRYSFHHCNYPRDTKIKFAYHYDFEAKDWIDGGICWEQFKEQMLKDGYNEEYTYYLKEEEFSEQLINKPNKLIKW